MIRLRPHLSFSLVLPLLIASLITFHGCSKFIRETYREPKVRVLQLTFTEQSSFGRLSSIPLVVTLEIKNPNTFALKASYLTYTVQAEGETLATGEKREYTEIPPEGFSTIDIPLTVSLDPIIRTVTRAAEKLEISLTAYGSVTVESFLGDIKIPFRKNFKKNLRSLIFPG